MDLLGGLVPRHLDGGDFPARLLGAAILVFHGAAGKGGIVQGKVAIGIARALARGQSPAFAQHHQQILHGAGLQLVGQLHLVGVEHVAAFIDRADIAGRLDLAGLAIPRHGIGAHGLFIASQHDTAGGGDHVGIAGVLQLVGLEPHLVALGGICLGTIALCRVGARGRPGWRGDRAAGIGIFGDGIGRRYRRGRLFRDRCHAHRGILCQGRHGPDTRAKAHGPGQQGMPGATQRQAMGKLAPISSGEGGGKRRNGGHAVAYRTGRS